MQTSMGLALRPVLQWGPPSIGREMEKVEVVTGTDELLQWGPPSIGREIRGCGGSGAAASRASMGPSQYREGNV